MSQMFHAAAEMSDLGWLLGVTTVVFMAMFCAWGVWAYLPRNREAMDEAAKMPLDDGGSF